MKLVILEVFTFLAVNICFCFALSCQNERNEKLFLNHDLLEFIKTTAEQVNISQTLKLLSKNEMDSVMKLEKFLAVSIKSVLLEMTPKVSSNKCVKDMEYMFENILSPGGWRMKMLDSFGKPESGILAGNLKWIGQYDECINIQAPFEKNSEVGGFHGRYCMLEVPIKFETASIPLSTAVCLPDSCNPNKTPFNILKNYNVNGSFSAMEEKLKSFLSNVTLTCKSTSRNLTTAAIVVICILSVFVVLAVIGSSITAFEYYMKGTYPKNHDDVSNSLGCLEKFKPFFNLFCIFTNSKKIMDTSSNREQFFFLHGIRFLSMTWVILCHVYSAMPGYLNNTAEAIVYIDRFLIQIITNGFFCVDSFFVLSGFLVGYIFFQQAQKTDGKFPWLYFYVHRIIRLAPVYFLVAAFYGIVSPFLGSGPLWPGYDIIPGCKENWWWNMLFINNFQPLSYEKCMPWSWYLANDMQFFAITPLFLITLWRWPKVGYSLLGLFFCIAISSNFILTYEYDLIAGFGSIISNVSDIQKILPRTAEFTDKIYKKPYTRIGPYLVGLALAYYIHRRKRSNAKSLNSVYLSVGWIVSSSVTLVCQFGQYHKVLTTLEASFYNAFARIGFAMGLGWVIFVCVFGQGGVVNSILSWKVFIPLSRISYCAYLIHPIVISTYLNSMRTLIYFNHINVVMLYFSILVISYAVSFVTSVLFESPVIRLDKLVRDKFAS